MQGRPCLVSGAVGASALTAVHQAARAITPDAPRMDVIAAKALEKSLAPLGLKESLPKNLEPWTLAGDLLSNSSYYSLVGMGNPKNAVKRGAILGALAGIAAVYLPSRLGLPDAPARKTKSTAVMTFAWYLLGGLAAGAAFRAMSSR